MNQPFIVLDPRYRCANFRDMCALTIMAKAPVAGQVKTRLSPPLTPEQAAGLNACFLKDTVANLEEAASVTAAKWVVSYTPAGEEVAFEGILPPGALLLRQRGTGFGERLLRTTTDLFACGFSSVCLIDSDSPTVPTSAFVRAVKELSGSDDRVVIGASDDGGYYLIGLNREHAALFHNISWSTSVVTQQTRQRAKHLGVPVTSLPTWYDVDEAESLNRLGRELLSRRVDLSHSSSAYPAPYTRAYLRQIGWSLDDSMGDAIPEEQCKADVVDLRN